MPAPKHVSTVISGGGPVGMLMASELSAYGVETVVLEQHPATQDVPKAGTLHARAAQSLARRGYLPAARSVPPHDYGHEVAAEFHFAGMPGLRIFAPAAEGDPVVGRSQGALERAFEARARERGATVLRDHRVESVADEGDRVAITARGPSGEVRLTADYLVGADGARSLAREQAGFDCATTPATLSAVLGMVELEDPYKAPAGWQLTERGWTVVMPNPFGLSRVAAFDFSGPCRHRHEPLTLRELRYTVSHIAGYDIPMSGPAFLDRFSDFTRLAENFRRNRVFLVGDAAHVHFPVGGQGLNLGLQDAFNLSWKLALVVGGQAPPSVLDSYDEERRPAGRRVIDNTRAQLALMHPDERRGPLRDLFARLLPLEQVSRLLGDMISDQDTVYPGPPGASPWTGVFLPNVALEGPNGTLRATGLFTDARPVLILSGSGAGSDAYRTIAAPWRNRVHTRTADSFAPLPWHAVLVRPDGYVAWAADDRTGPDTSGLEEALRRWLGLPTPPAPSGRS